METAHERRSRSPCCCSPPLRAGRLRQRCNSVDSDVSSYSHWPAERKPAHLRLRAPAVAAGARRSRQQLLEDAARGALEGAGFTPAADAERAPTSRCSSARASPRNDRSPCDDPFWWRGGLSGTGRSTAAAAVSGGPAVRLRLRAPRYYDSPTYEREVALLIRDRKTGEPLYEARASSDGTSPAIDTLLPAMFEAALKDFPRRRPINPRRVTVADAAGAAAERRALSARRSRGQRAQVVFPALRACFARLRRCAARGRCCAAAPAKRAVVVDQRARW